MKNQFCFPICIELTGAGYLRIFVLLIHVITLVILILSTASFILVMGCLLIAVSLRLSLGRLSVIASYRKLIGTDEDHWYLVGEDNRRSAIAVYRAQIIGPFLLLAIRRFGHSCQWIARYDDQTNDQWHRMKVFIGFYL